MRKDYLISKSIHTQKRVKFPLPVLIQRLRARWRGARGNRSGR